MGILAKAYLRRGMALESLEKYAEAKEDFLSVKELQPSNLQASKGLSRINQALRDLMKVDLSDIDAKMLRIKDAGNSLYSKKNFTEAISTFSEGIDMYIEN